jgi:hypothetical protein
MQSFDGVGKSTQNQDNAKQEETRDALLASRRHQYHRYLIRYRFLLSLVCIPRFCATKDVALFEEYKKIGNFLKKEADDLFQVGVNVYNIS